MEVFESSSLPPLGKTDVLIKNDNHRELQHLFLNSHIITKASICCVEYSHSAVSISVPSTALKIFFSCFVTHLPVLSSHLLTGHMEAAPQTYEAFAVFGAAALSTRHPPHRPAPRLEN